MRGVKLKFFKPAMGGMWDSTIAEHNNPLLKFEFDNHPVSVSRLFK